MPDWHPILDSLDQVAGPEQTDYGLRWTALCPVHDDHSPSLSITLTSSGNLLPKCWVGCPESEVREALGMGEWMPDGIEHQATYPYTTVDGDLVFEVLRGVKDGRKQIRQRVPDPEKPSGYSWSIKSLTRNQKDLLYRAPDVALAVAMGEPVYVVEGEKDVHTAIQNGLIATCNARGAGKFTSRHAQQLKGARVKVVMDNDDAGHMHGAMVYDSLQGVATIVELFDVHPDLGEKADLTDHFEAGHTLDDLVPVERDGLNGLPPPPPTTPAPPGHDSFNPQSGHADSELSERFVDEVLQGRYLWAAAAEWNWLQWTGRIWARCSETQVIEEARRWLTGMARDLLHTDHDSLRDRNDAIKVGNQLMNKAKTLNVTYLARGQVMVDFEEFDVDPDILVVSNGVVDLTTGDLMPHDPSRLVTKSTNVNYNPNATSDDWSKALTAVTPEVGQWLQQRFGQACTGYPPGDDVMMMLFGEGKNGKSSIIGGVMESLGDYAGLVPDRVLIDERSNSHPTELMPLRGLRLAVVEETPESRFLHVNRLKKICGTDRIIARFTHKDNVEFRPTWSLAVTSNYELAVSEGDTGTWRRLARVPFPYRFRVAESGEAIDRTTGKATRDCGNGSRHRRRRRRSWHGWSKVLCSGTPMVASCHPTRMRSSRAHGCGVMRLINGSVSVMTCWSLNPMRSSGWMTCIRRCGPGRQPRVTARGRCRHSRLG